MGSSREEVKPAQLLASFLLPTVDSGATAMLHRQAGKQAGRRKAATLVRQSGGATPPPHPTPPCPTLPAAPWAASLHTAWSALS